MKPRNLCSLLVAWILVAATSDAQTAAAAQSEEAVVLSPFTVSSEKDVGYQATDTLAGTRLRTSVKDIGASISIYIKDLMNDLGVANANDLLVYATGMEASGPGGNYSGSTADINAAQVTGDGIRTRPQQTRTRGLASPSYTRGFFATGLLLLSRERNQGGIPEDGGGKYRCFGD